MTPRHAAELARLRIEAAELRAENAELRAENAELRARVAFLESIPSTVVAERRRAHRQGDTT